jgi:Glyoxalase/Bleomycin resistance protein/Dioxygenase superfamily
MGKLCAHCAGVDLPLSELKQILRSGDDARTRECLIAHRERLLAQTSLLRDQLATLDDFIQKGVSVAAAQGNRIVMINIAVDDLQQSRRFYEELLDVEFVEDRHDDGSPHLNATFGEWNTPNWFLLSSRIRAETRSASTKPDQGAEGSLSRR